MDKPKATTPAQKQVKLLSKTPTLAVDGNGVFINDKNVADLVFFQIIQETPESIDVNGVASLRMDVPQLEQFVETINKTLQTHKEKQKKN